MPNKKTKDDLLAEKVSAEKKLEQYTHQLQRAVNREKYLVKGEAKKRTHILCNIGGAVLSFWPEVQYLTKVEQYQIFEKLAQQADVNTAVQGDQLLPVLPIVLAKNCTANIMGKPVIIPARAV